MSRLFLALFAALVVLASRFLYGHAEHAHMGDHILPQCTASQPYSLRYTGLAPLDAQICNYVVVFHSVLVPQNGAHTPIISYFAAAGAPYALLTVLNRFSRPRLDPLAYPTLWLMATQIFSFGLTFPIYSFLWVYTSNGRLPMPLRSFTRVDAESVLFAMVLGGAIPSIAMVYLLDPYITWLWQIYPVFIFLFRHLYLLIRPPSDSAQSAFPVLRFTYIATFIAALLSHIVIVWPLFADWSALKTLIIPSITPLEPSATLRLIVLHFLKWDFLLGYLGAALASLWSAQSPKQLLAMIAWYVFSSPLIGIGAAFMALAIWRDARDQGSINLE
ncbi:hypothetical protein JR316_0003662 [Psilocybe cubensis]|uniref:Uncharacterized protein n=2 Tax=Psilocybe cubensis TaxID=181762 RepID=A0ACB8H959_PSICU|nr:hypothetical protein JR316_0003662 [Psilocybe cubensis]KAH9484182.1 hypothetical protein JR316_0003662 [Psilocybe cubensis]